MWKIIICTVLLLITHPAKVHAQVIISEIYPAPMSGESEWIELVNLSKDPIDITGWNLWDELASPSQLYTFTESTTLASKSFIVVTLPSHKLNNSGDAVLLYNSSGQVQNTLWFTSTSSGKSWQRVNAQSDQFVSTDPTPGTENSAYPLLILPPPSPPPLPTPTSAPMAAHVTLTEFSACPAGGNEWIELYNTADTIILNNWMIRDEVGNQRKISGSLPSHSFTRFDWSGAMLRNSGDSFSVFTDTGEEIGTAAYKSCQTGSSHVFDGTRWIQVIPDEVRQHQPLPSPSPSATPPAPIIAPAPQSQTETQPAQPATPTATITAPLSPMPTFPPYKPENLITNAIKHKTILSMPEPSIPYIPLLSVILGGLLVFIPGTITLYALHRRSPPIQ